jgi:hypothetical protein
VRLKPSAPLLLTPVKLSVTPPVSLNMAHST